MSLGNAYSNKLELDMFVPSDFTGLSKSKIEMFVGILINGEISYVPLGVFFADDVKTTDNFKSVKITAYDAMLKLNDLGNTYKCGNTKASITPVEIIEDIAKQAGVITDIPNSEETISKHIIQKAEGVLYSPDGAVYETVCTAGIKNLIGDSISSYEGYSKRTDHIVYPSYDVFKPERTYWGRFCKITGAEPLVIDGVGSSTVTDNRDGLNGDETFLGMYHDNRALQLGTDSHTPDIIIVEGGTNDMALNIALGTYDGSADISEITNLNWFREAYAVMLDKIRTAYPKAEIYCCTIMARGGTSDYKIKQYNEAIKDIAELMGAKITDTAKCINMKNRNSFLSSDGIHPTYQGHIRMCDELLKAVI